MKAAFGGFIDDKSFQEGRFHIVLRGSAWISGNGVHRHSDSESDTNGPINLIN